MRRPDTVRLGRKEILLLLRERKGREDKENTQNSVIIIIIIVKFPSLSLAEKKNFIHRFVNVNVYVCNDIRVEDKPIQG